MKKVGGVRPEGVSLICGRPIWENRSNLDSVGNESTLELQAFALVPRSRIRRSASMSSSLRYQCLFIVSAVTHTSDYERLV